MGNEQYGEIVDVGQSFVSIGVQDSVTAYTPAATEYLAPTGEFQYDPKQDFTSTSYDGITMFGYTNEGAGETKLTVSGVPEKLAARLTGKPYDEAKGLLLDTGSSSNAPLCALSTQSFFGDTDGNYKLIQFLKGKFTLGAISAKSKGDKTDPRARDLIFHPLVTQYQWAVPDVNHPGQTINKGLKGISGDTTDPAFTVTPAQWFAQVQTPDTVSPVAAIALPSSNPANNATAVVASVKPTLTFNNAIESDAVTLIKASDNSVVNVTKSYDTAKKVLTITPTSNLTAAGIYNIIVAGVKDIYGQILATSVLKFTVA